MTETIEKAEQMMRGKRKLFSIGGKQKPIDETIQRGRELADRTLDQDIQETRMDIIALEGVEIEYTKRLDDIARQVDNLLNEQEDIGDKRKANRVRLKNLKSSIHRMEIALLEGQ